MATEFENENINSLIGQLLDESYSQDHGFESMSASAIGDILLGDSGESLEADSDMAGSFERARDLYCLLLQEMESSGWLDRMNDALSDLAIRHSGTELISESATTTPTEGNFLEIPEPLTEIDALATESVEPSAEEMPPDEGSHFSEISLEAEQITSAIESSPEGLAPEAPEGELPEDGLVPETVPEDAFPEEEFSEEVASDSEPPAGEEAAVESLTQPLSEETVNQPVNDEAAELEVPSFADEEMNPIEEPNPDVVVAQITAPAEEPVLPGGPGMTEKAKEYWKLAHFFKSLKQANNFPLPPIHLNKLIGQSYCFSLEAELWARLQTPLYGFWARRDEAIRSILDPKTSKVALNPSLQESLKELASIHRDWLWEGKLPETGILNSLRYFLATQEILKLRPTLMDYGVILLLFGHSETMGNFTISDFLDVEGLSLEMMCEMSFRLFRLSTLSAKTVGIASEFTPEFLAILEQDIVHVFDFLLMLRRSEGQTMTERVA